MAYGPGFPMMPGMPYPGMMPMPGMPIVPPHAYAARPTPPKAVVSKPPVPAARDMTVYVGKIPSDIDDEFMMALLGHCGAVAKWKRIADPETGKSKSFGFCTFANPQAAGRALRCVKPLDIDGGNLLLNVDSKTQELLDAYQQKVKFGPADLQADDDAAGKMKTMLNLRATERAKEKAKEEAEAALKAEEEAKAKEVTQREAALSLLDDIKEGKYPVEEDEQSRRRSRSRSRGRRSSYRGSRQYRDYSRRDRSPRRRRRSHSRSWSRGRRRDRKRSRRSRSGTCSRSGSRPRSPSGSKSPEEKPAEQAAVVTEQSPPPPSTEAPVAPLPAPTETPTKAPVDKATLYATPLDWETIEQVGAVEGDVEPWLQEEFTRRAGRIGGELATAVVQALGQRKSALEIEKEMEMLGGEAEELVVELWLKLTEL